MDYQTPFTIIVSIFVLIIVLSMFKSSLFIVHQQTKEVIERLGKFHHLADPGLNFKWPIIDRRVWKVELRVQQLGVWSRPRPRTMVFAKVPVAVE